MTNPDRNPESTTLFALVGPTASGKSELGVQLAERFSADVLSLDSMLVYRGMDVGTARLTAAERRGVRHHLEELVDPLERYDVQRYLSDASATESALRAAGRPALYVGGTGLYLKALINGLFDGPPVDRELRARLEERARVEGAIALHRELCERDPSLGRRLHHNDLRRVVRGLEVLEQTGRALSDWQQQWNVSGRRARLVGLAPPLELLEERIVRRTRSMLANGFVEEVQGLLARGGFGPTSAQALGYPEVVAHLEGALTLAELHDHIVLRTRQFARRQRTWYRQFTGIAWIPFELDAEARVEFALDHLRADRAESDAGGQADGGTTHSVR